MKLQQCVFPVQIADNMGAQTKHVWTVQCLHFIIQIHNPNISYTKVVTDMCLI